jgi:hypothetical protein
MGAVQELFNITGYHDQDFYDTIFNLHNQNDQRLDKLNNILDINEHFKFRIVFSNSNDFASAAANFARKMVLQSNELRDDIRCKNFCDFFEFVIIEFKDIVYQINYQNNYQDHLRNYYFNGPLLITQTKQITDNAFIEIERRYDHYAEALDTAVLTLINANPTQLGNRIIYNEIQRMARNNRIRFGSSLSGVCHWRKHRWMHFTYKLSAIDYLIEANETVTSGHLIEDSAFEFKNDIDIKRFRLAIVNENRPDELVTYYIKRRNTNSLSYTQGTRLYRP